MFVVVSEDMRVTEDIAQPSALAVLHLVAQTRSVKRVVDFLSVIVMLATKETDTTVQMSMSVKVLKQTAVIRTPSVPTLKALMYAVV